MLFIPGGILSRRQFHESGTLGAPLERERTLSDPRPTFFPHPEAAHRQWA